MGKQSTAGESRPVASAWTRERKRHRVAGLFAGIGGFESGMHDAGHDTRLLCENDPGASAVLEERFPNVPVHPDVVTLKSLPGDVTLVAAGFPCQDLSQAGNTTGISGARSSLVGEVFRLIQEARTPWIILENVPFMLQLGRGAAMELIVGEFERLGYRWAYRVVDTRAFGLPQRRRRVYLVASNEGDPRSVLFADETELKPEPRLNGHPVACGFYWTEGLRGLGWAVDAVPTLKGGSTIGIPSSPAVLLSDGQVVTLDVRDAERLQGFPPEWTQPAETVGRSSHRWKLVGNAVSVPAAKWLGGRLARLGEVLPFETATLRPGASWPTAAWCVDGTRLSVSATEFPVRLASTPLEQFLQYRPKPLSAKATSGFLKRASQAKLRFPEGFIEKLEHHLRLVEGEGSVESAVRGRRPATGQT